MLSTGEKVRWISPWMCLCLLPCRYRPTLGRWVIALEFSCLCPSNHVATEGILRQHPRVAAAVMFGRGRFQNGVLLELKPGYEFDPKNQEKLAEFKDSLWSVVFCHDVLP
jgi:hypothetical protein